MANKSGHLLIFILVAIVILGIILVVNFLSFNTVQSFVVDQYRENQQIETAHAAELMESHIRGVSDDLITLSRVPLSDRKYVRQCSPEMRQVHDSLAGRIDALFRVDAEGTIIQCSQQDFAGYLGENIAEEDYFSIPYTSRGSFISGVVAEGSNRFVIVAVPLFESTEYTPYPNYGGTFEGIILAKIAVDRLYDLYFRPWLDTSESRFFVYNPNTDELILRSSSFEDFEHVKMIVSESTLNINVFEELHELGESLVTSENVLLGTDHWRLVVVTPKLEILENIRPIQTGQILGLLFVVLVLIGVTILLITLVKSRDEIQMKLEKAHVTLDKLGIHIGVEESLYHQSESKLKPKKLYLIKDSKDNEAHELFLSALNDGYAGLGLVRQNPDVFKKKYGLQKTSFIWLANRQHGNTPASSEIQTLYSLIAEFVTKSKRSVVLFDRLEYIFSVNPPEQVVSVVHSLQDLASEHETIIILDVASDAVDAKYMRLLEGGTSNIYENELKKMVSLSDLERGMLNFINEMNVKHAVVSYKDITSKFNITKPTTRARIDYLYSVGFVSIEKRGRVKSITITSAGRRMLE